MRQLHPTFRDEVDAVSLYRSDERPPYDDRPWVLLNMVASVDGATARDGVSRPLSSEVDREIFHALRALADVVLVGAGTVRAERYGPPREYPERIEQGRAPAPRLVVVSGRLDLDPEARLFANATEPPIVATSASADPARREALAGRAELVVAGEHAVDLAELLRHLRSTGVDVVACEGGGHLNGTLLAGGLIDEVCLTMSAQLAGGSSPRTVAAAPEVGVALELARVLEHDDDLFLRYAVRR